MPPINTSGSDVMTTEQPTKEVLLILRITNYNWSNELQDETSAVYSSLSADAKKNLEETFQGSDVESDLTISHISFREGSVIVEYTLLVSSEGSVIVEYTLLISRVDVDDVHAAFLRRTDNGTSIGNFTLDRSFTSFQFVTATTVKTTTVRHREPDTYQWPGWAIGLLLASSILVLFLIVLSIVLCCVSSKRRARHTYHVHRECDFEAAAPSKEGSYDDSTFSSRGASRDNSPSARVRQINSQAAGHKRDSEPQVCDSKASTLLVRPTGWPEPNTALSDSGKENTGYGEEEPYRESYVLDVSRNTSSAQAHVTDEMGTQSSFHMETFRPPSSINSNGHCSPFLAVTALRSLGSLLSIPCGHCSPFLAVTALRSLRSLLSVPRGHCSPFLAVTALHSLRSLLSVPRGHCSPFLAVTALHSLRSLLSVPCGRHCSPFLGVTALRSLGSLLSIPCGHCSPFLAVTALRSLRSLLSVPWGHCSPFLAVTALRSTGSLLSVSCGHCSPFHGSLLSVPCGHCSPFHGVMLPRTALRSLRSLLSVPRGHCSPFLAVTALRSTGSLLCVPCGHCSPFHGVTALRSLRSLLSVPRGHCSPFLAVTALRSTGSLLSVPCGHCSPFHGVTALRSLRSLLSVPRGHCSPFLAVTALRSTGSLWLRRQHVIEQLRLRLYNAFVFYCTTRVHVA
ncbi:hypothetical protein LSAT2_010515 [Lamellibrachia satsuma]|nr:hypothetical protein LSAT2_010515 [Lamellibrachia satsuma]